ncbi:hypothetical protein OIU76_020202 [Salix suchowensis]|nr:hypothetical protein OIU76_020202 [Salix suchowensis]
MKKNNHQQICGTAGDETNESNEHLLTEARCYPPIKHCIVRQHPHARASKQAPNGLQNSGNAQMPKKKRAGNHILDLLLSLQHFQAIRRVSSRPQDPSPARPSPDSSQPPPRSKKIIDIQSQTYSPQKHRKSAEGAKSHDTLRNRGAAEMVPVNFDFSSQGVPANGKSKLPTAPLPSIPQSTQVASSMEPEAKPSSMAVLPSPSQGNKANSPKVESPQHKKFEEGNSKPGKHIEDRFTEYINRTKLKIKRTLSNAGHDKGTC